jgi:NAD(P)-dependent dehydrogenase (short-subunit alcohol dehydrogenase family)
MRTAIVVGASKGIGRAVAVKLASQKIKVIAVARSKDELSQLATQLPLVTPVAGDVCSRDTVSCAVDAVGNSSIDALIFCAALVPKAEAVPELDTSDINSLDNPLGSSLKTNTLSLVPWIRATIESLRQSSGRIVYMTSAVGSVIGSPGMASYAIAKAASTALIKCLALEESLIAAKGRESQPRRGISCAFAINPGLVDTDSFEEFKSQASKIFPNDPGLSAVNSAQKINDMYPDSSSGAMPKGTLLLRSPETVGNIVALAAIFAPPSLTGSVINVDDPKLQSLSWTDSK